MPFRLEDYFFEIVMANMDGIERVFSRSANPRGQQACEEEAAREPSIAAEPDEVEFDHVPTEAELDAAFPNRRKAAVTM